MRFGLAVPAQKPENEYADSDEGAAVLEELIALEGTGKWHMM